ncbi:MAG: serine hydrolase domain-containing protein [Chthoniobacterales bacterium]
MPLKPLLLSFFLIFLFFLTASMGLAASSHQDLQVFLDHWRIDHHISSVVVTTEDLPTKKITTYTSGFTRRGAREPVTEKTVFGIGSITKTFVAATLLQLQEEGKIKLDTPIGSYFPEYPRWSSITVRQLLNMTSGIANTDFSKERDDYENTILTSKKIVTSIYQQPDLFAPGSEWRYSNTNYFLLGLLIEKISGVSFAEVITTRFLKPLHLTHTFYSRLLPKLADVSEVQGASGAQTRSVHEVLEDASTGATQQFAAAVELGKKSSDSFYSKDVMAQIAHAYAGKRDITTFNASHYGPAGSMLSDSTDLLTWTQALLTPGIILSAESIREMEMTIAVPSTPPKPEGCRYGLGIYSLDVLHLGTIWYYAGVIRGYTSCFIFIPSQQKIIVAQVATWPGEHFEVLFPNQPLMKKLLEE